MNIEITRNSQTDDILLTAKITRTYIIDSCEPYGCDELCNLITNEQGMGIIEDAILMALHLKLKQPTKE